MEQKNFARTYADWVLESSVELSQDGCTELTLPFLDRHNDFLQVMIQEETGKLTLSDAGYVLADCYTCGWEKTAENQAKVQEIVAKCGVQLKNEEIFLECSREEFPVALTRLVQAMMLVGSLPEMEEIFSGRNLDTSGKTELDHILETINHS